MTRWGESNIRSICLCSITFSLITTYIFSLELPWASKGGLRVMLEECSGSRSVKNESWEHFSESTEDCGVRSSENASDTKCSVLQIQPQATHIDGRKPGQTTWWPLRCMLNKTTCRYDECNVIHRLNGVCILEARGIKFQNGIQAIQANRPRSPIYHTSTMPRITPRTVPVSGYQHFLTPLRRLIFDYDPLSPSQHGVRSYLRRPLLAMAQANPDVEVLIRKLRRGKAAVLRGHYGM
jgi:hypothetical protein